MGKKKKEIIDKEFEGFTARACSPTASPRRPIQTLWDVMLPFSGYAFNKSHTAGYGLVSYWTAYLKANYPAEFMAALLTVDRRQQGQVGGLPRRVPPHGHQGAAARTSTSPTCGFAAVGGDIRFGLGAVRNVGANVVESIIKTRKDKGRFTSFTDFLEKVDLLCCNKRIIESLIKAGAFDSFGQPRRALLMVHEEAVDAITGLKRQEAMGQFDLFVDATTQPAGVRRLAAGPPQDHRRGVAAQADARLRAGDARACTCRPTRSTAPSASCANTRPSRSPR